MASNNDHIDPGPGGVLKDGYNAALGGTMRQAWGGIQKVAASGFGKGLLLTGLLVIGVMALVAGYMGAGGTLAVGAAHITTFEGGFGAGISKALEFLTSGLGLATLGIGGTLGAVSEVRGHQHKIAAAESERLAMEYQRKLELEKMKNRQPEQQPEKKAEKPAKEHHHHHHHEHPMHDKQQDDGIYVKGSIIKDSTFCAAELKRRTEREATVECKTVA
jgi:hypothetical protein